MVPVSALLDRKATCVFVFALSLSLAAPPGQSSLRARALGPHTCLLLCCHNVLPFKAGTQTFSSLDDCARRVSDPF